MLKQTGRLSSNKTYKGAVWTAASEKLHKDVNFKVTLKRLAEKEPEAKKALR